MRTSLAGIDLIKRFEGLELESYQDIAGIWTIGYGHTETAGPNQKITARQAEELLQKDLRPREDAVSRLASVPLNQNEFDALVSFVYNVGIEAFRKSTARARLNRGDRVGAAEALTWWNKATVNGVLREVLGLTRRRAAERALFLSPVNPPIVRDPERVQENSRVAPLEEAPRRESLGESRTIQGATVAGGAGVAAAGLGRNSAEELHQLESNIESGRGLTTETTPTGPPADPSPAEDPGPQEADPETVDGAPESQGPDDAEATPAETGANLVEADPAEAAPPSVADSDAVDPDSAMAEAVVLEGLRPAKHEQHVVEAQMQVALMILIVLATLYIIIARVEDWFRFRR